MNSLQALTKIMEFPCPYFETNDVAALLSIPPMNASQLLSRLAKHGQITKLMRGKWAVKKLTDPLSCAEFLTYPLPAYVSLHTAMYQHGMISQIPTSITMISLARNSIIKNSLGIYQIYHIELGFFHSYEIDHKTGIKIATPEKALLDFLYLKPSKSTFAKKLPEIDLPKNFSFKRAEKILDTVKSKARRSFMRRELEKMVAC